MRYTFMAVDVQPAGSVEFALVPGTAPSASLTLHNRSLSESFAFTLRASSSDKFAFQPPHGILAPGTTAAITIVLNCVVGAEMLSKAGSRTSDNIVIRTTAVSATDRRSVPDVFTKTPHDRVTNVQVACRFTNARNATPRSSSSHKVITRVRAGSSDAASANLSPTAQSLMRLQAQRKDTEQRRKTLETFRDDDVRNHKCFNCGDIQSAQERPTNVCLDFGIFVCSVCAGFHKEFRHRVKAFATSTFSDDEVSEIVQSGGNGAAYAKWRKTLNKTHSFPGATIRDKARECVRLTFVERRWTGGNMTSSSAANSQLRNTVPSKSAPPAAPTAGATSSAKTVNPKPTPWTKLLPRLGKTWPWLRDIQVEPQWSGDPVCITSDDAPSKYEKELRDNLTFVKAALTPKQTPGPLFAGVNMLRGLADSPFLEASLFFALEVLAMPVTTSHEAIDALESYANKLREANARAHPLMMVALARYAIASQRDTLADPKLAAMDARATARKLLEGFSQMYPAASKIWFSSSDKDALQTKATPTIPAPTSKPLSPDQLAWQKLKEQGAKSDAMDELLRLLGLSRVKRKALELFKKCLKLQNLSPERRKKHTQTRLNFCFTGNPGTGKTTVAKLFAQILVDTGMRRNANIAKCSPQKLKDDGADAFRTTIDEAMGGVLFIDEAYELDPNSDPRGKPIVSELLLAAEEKRHDLSIILAGYEDDIEEKLYKSNEGLRSRFEQVPFEDFDEDDLRVIWDSLVEQKGWSEENASVRIIACRRIARGANTKGFGNARAVDNFFTPVADTAFARDDCDAENPVLRIVDVIGERPAANPKLKAVLEEIESKIGWTKIKQRSKDLVDLCETNYERELAATDTDVAAKFPVVMNALFLGNPGTGKTTFASLYGKLLKRLNLLSNGEVLKKTASDFKGSYVGESQQKTNDILAQAKGKVLIIDEAYGLNDTLYGKQVLDVLVEKVQGHESQDIAIILIGYEAQMAEMFRVQNPGLASRFPMETAFFFEDYGDAELLDICANYCKNMRAAASVDVMQAIVKSLGMQRRQAHFGNARAVETLMRTLINNARARISRRGGKPGRVITLDVQDIASEVARRIDNKSVGNERNRDPLSMLDGLYRMDNIRGALRRLANKIEHAQARGQSQPPVGHFVFRGSPGTGKTTVARTMGSILFRMGVLASDRIVETTGLQMTGEYVGQTKKKAETLLQEARGAILFIDEAYTLADGPYGEEALTTLVAALTDPTYQGTVVIIAGYALAIERIFHRNEGLKRRFRNIVDFEDWNVDDCMRYLIKLAADGNYTLDPEAVETMRDLFKQLRTFRHFGNAGDVQTTWDKLKDCHSETAENRAGPQTIQGAAAIEASDLVLKEKAPPRGASTLTHGNSIRGRNWMPVDGNRHDPYMALEQQAFQCEDMLPVREQSQPRTRSPQSRTATNSRSTTQHLTKQEQMNKSAEEQNATTATVRDADVRDADWQELEAAKENYKQLLEQLQREEDARKAREEAQRKLREYETEQQRLRDEADRLAREEAERQRLELLAKLEKLRQEEEAARKLQEEAAQKLREYEAKRQRLRQLAKCPAGFEWYQVGGGWRCSAGGHFVSNAELERNYTWYM